VLQIGHCCSQFYLRYFLDDINLVLFLALCICDGGSFYIASTTLVELDDHCAIMLKFLIKELQLVVENFSMLDHILLHLL
jgi:hypothetical protein